MGHNEFMNFRGVDPDLVSRILVHNDKQDLRGRIMRLASKYYKYKKGVISILVVAADQKRLDYFLGRFEGYPNNSPTLTVGDFIKECYKELGIDY